MSEIESFGGAGAERDLSRAHWQRTVGSILMREFTEGLFQDPRLTTEQLDAANESAENIWNLESVDKVWRRAYVTSQVLVKNSLNVETGNLPERLENQLYRFTYAKHPEDILREGLQTQSMFPISLARSLSGHAENNEVPGFAVNDLTDVSKILKRGDFKTMVGQSLLANNGFWRGFSMAVNDLATTPLGYVTPYLFGKDGSVAFSTQALNMMKGSLRQVNKHAHPDETTIHELPSSGCPARHTHPTFTTEEDMENLEMLATYFGKSPEDLLRPAEQSIARRGLDHVAKGLALANPYFVQLDAQRAKKAQPLSVG